MRKYGTSTTLSRRSGGTRRLSVEVLEEAAGREEGAAAGREEEAAARCEEGDGR